MTAHSLLDQAEQLPPLTEHELDELIRLAPPGLRQQVARLCMEVKMLRDNQAEREFCYDQEIQW